MSHLLLELSRKKKNQKKSEISFFYGEVQTREKHA